MVAADEIAVFLDTSIGTRVALSSPPESNVGDLKRKIELQHYSCFPTIGEIKVLSLMVKKKSTFYHLPDSVPVRVLQSSHGACFFRAVVSPLGTRYNEDWSNRTKMSKDIAGELVQDEHGTIDMPQTTEFISDLDSVKEDIFYGPSNKESLRLDQEVKVYKYQHKSDKRHDHSSFPLERIPSGSFREEISVSSLITKYFSASGGEINSSSIPHEREMDAEKASRQYNNVINHESVGCQANISDFSAKHGSSGRFDPDLNTSVSREFRNETSAFSNATCSSSIPHGTTRDAENLFFECSNFARSKDKTCRNKSFKSKKPVGRRAPHCHSKLFSSNSYLDDKFKLDNSIIRAAKYELGKRLSSAAIRIWSPDRANRSSKSTFVKRANHSTTCELADIVKSFSFVSSGSDG